MGIHHSIPAPLSKYTTVIMADSQSLCCCNDIFRAAKGLTIAEIVLILFGVILGFFTGSIGSGYDIIWILLQLAYLAVEYYGIHKKTKCLILFSCVIRILLTISAVIVIIELFSTTVLVAGFIVLAWQIFRSYAQLKMYRVVKQDSVKPYQINV